jgi:hypothetical protein
MGCSAEECRRSLSASLLVQWYFLERLAPRRVDYPNPAPDPPNVPPPGSMCQRPLPHVPA